MGTDDAPKKSAIAVNAEEPKAEATSEYGSRKEAINRILDKLEKQFIEGELKGTVADYLRLIQVVKEMGDERPREIEIRWVNSIRGETSE
jgi:predicted adenine nucleotide alpha hydrolase (AANH) superfamily ATPase